MSAPRNQVQNPPSSTVYGTQQFKVTALCAVPVAGLPLCPRPDAKCYVVCAARNLPYDINEDDIRQFFSPVGNPNRISCVSGLLPLNLLPSCGVVWCASHLASRSGLSGHLQCTKSYGYGLHEKAGTRNATACVLLCPTIEVLVERTNCPTEQA